MRLTQFSSTRFSFRCCGNSGRPRRFRSLNSVHASRNGFSVTFAVLVEHCDPLTRESYLNINNVDEDDLEAEQEIDLLDLFQESRSRSGSRR